MNEKLLNFPSRKLVFSLLLIGALLPKSADASMYENNESTIYEQEKITVKGIVKDQNGEPIPGVVISIVGKSTSTFTNEKGEYTIETEKESILRFSFMGFITEEVPVQGRNAIDVTLLDDAKMLEDVVVTGMGMRVDRRTFTGAASKIGGDASRIGGLVDPSRGLEGRVAGVSVQNVSGTFGAAPKIRVRGATSIYGSSKPLWVVDGVIIEDVADVSADQLSTGDATSLISSAVAGLNANDIESFQILKDGAATSIYGARAMAGVIVITTKKGSPGRTSLNYVGEFTNRAIPSYRNFNILNSQDQMGVYQEMFDRGYLRLAETSNAASSGVYGKMYELINNGQLYNDQFTSSTAVNAYLREAEYRNTDWFKVLFNNNIMQNHSVSLSSGSEKSNYYTSVSFLDDAGWTKQSAVKRYTANLNATYHLPFNLSLNLLTNGSFRNQKAPGTMSQETDLVRGKVKRDYDINPFSYATTTSRTLDPNEFYTRSYTPFNILHELDHNYLDLNVGDAKFQGELRWKALSKLEFAALAAFRYQNVGAHHHVLDQSNQAQSYKILPTSTVAIQNANPQLWKDPENAFALPISVMPYGGIYNRQDYTMLANDYRFTAQYDTKFNQKHSLNVFGAITSNSSQRNNTWFRGWGLQYDNGEVPYLDYNVFKRAQLEGNKYFTVNNTRFKEVAFVGNATYSYANKYTLNGTLRYEGSNRLGKSRSARWMPTWNLSGLWTVSDEDFFEPIKDKVSFLSLKASYSLTGDRGPAFVTNSRAVINSYIPWRPSTSDNEPGLIISQLENSDLTYEKKHELNLGANLGFFHNRLNVEFDWFKRNNFDLIGIVNTQGLGGEISKFGNVADMKSQGAELSVSGIIIDRKNFQWSANLIYTHVTNKVTKLETRARAIDLISGMGFAKEGYPVRSLFSIPFKGLNDQGLPTFLNEKGETTTSDIFFQEREKLDYLVYSGTTDPTDLGSLGNTFTYKGLRLNVLMTYSFGNVVRMNPVFSNVYSDLDAMTKDFVNRWAAAGDENYTNIPAIASLSQQRTNPLLAYGYNAYNFSTERIAKGDFIRVKDISLSYELPKRVVTSWKMNSLGFRLNATNLWLLHSDKKLSGQDPEFITSGGVALPIPRQYTLTLRLGI